MPGMAWEGNRDIGIGRGTRARRFQPSPPWWGRAVCSYGVIGWQKRVVPKQISRKKWIGFSNMLRQRHDDRRRAGKNAINPLANFGAATFWCQSDAWNTSR